MSGSTFGGVGGKLSLHVKFEVGTGTNIRFGMIYGLVRLCCVVLQEAFPELLRIARDKEALVANHLEGILA